MVTLDKIRSDMKERFLIDKDLHMVDVRADTIDEALSDASVQLNTKISNLQYEVVERGSDGFLGIGKKPWFLKIYQDPNTITKATVKASDGLIIDDESEDANVVKNQDGMYYVRHFGSDIVLKVLLPIGDGTPVELRDVLDDIKRQDTVDYDESLVKKLVKNGTDGQYTTVGQYKHIQGADALVSVDVTKDHMKCFIVVSGPGMSGADISADAIKRSLITQGIVEQCIDEKKIEEFVDNPVYDNPFLVAEAIIPVDGKDAYLSYNFETDPKKLKAKVSESGNINYKENRIQNVIAGQPLATKIPAER